MGLVIVLFVMTFVKSTQAKVVTFKSKTPICLPQKPLDKDNTEVKFFWVDKFNCVVQAQTDQSVHPQKDDEILSKVNPFNC